MNSGRGGSERKGFGTSPTFIPFKKGKDAGEGSMVATWNSLHEGPQ